MSDEPATSSASASSTIEYACSTPGLGTLSPKYTMSGLRIPPQAGQSMNRNDEVSATTASASGATAIAPIFSVVSANPGLSRSSRSASAVRLIVSPQPRQITSA